MPGAAVANSAQARLCRLHLLKRCRAQRFHTEQGGGAFTFGTTLCVGTAAVLVANVAIGDEHNDIGAGKGHLFCFQRPAVEQQQMILLAQRAGTLIHDAAGNPRILVFGLLAEPRQLQRCDRMACHGGKQRGRRHL